MAPGRAAAGLLKRTAIAPRARAVSAQLSLRQHHSNRARPVLRQQPSTICAARPLPSRTGLGRPIAVQAYSTNSEGSPNRIWDFEAMQNLTASPNPSVTIIDVREPHELQQTGRVPGALNVPVTSAPDSWHISDEEFEDRYGQPRPARDVEVVFYCKAGVRSRAAAGLARDAGWTKVGEYPGSWTDWFEKGGKVER